MEHDCVDEDKEVKADTILNVLCPWWGWIQSRAVVCLLLDQLGLLRVSLDSRHSPTLVSILHRTLPAAGVLTLPPWEAVIGFHTSVP